MILLELVNLIFLHRYHKNPDSLSTEIKIALQNLALSLINSAHLYTQEGGSAGTKMSLLSPKSQSKGKKD